MTPKNPILADFRNFLYVVWKHLGLPPPTPKQYEMAYWLQHGGRRKVLQAFRGVGKSWITSAFVVWNLLRDPDKKFLIVSASKDRAIDFSTFTLRLIREMHILRHLVPEGDRTSKLAFDVAPAKAAHAPSVKSVGIFGQLTGSRADHIIADDVEIPNNSATQTAREKLLKTVMEFEAIIVPGGYITFLGTPQTEESIYSKLQERGYETRIWPARYPQNAKIASYQGCLAEDILNDLENDSSLVGKPTDPQRFNEMDLHEREAAWGRSGFALQFMLDTSLSDAEKYPLKTGDLIIANVGRDKAPISLQYGSGPDQEIKEFPGIGFAGDRFYRPMFVDTEWADYEGAILAIDPSGRGKDETGYAVVKALHGNLFVPEAGGIKGGYENDTLNALAGIAKKHQVKRILIEANFGDGMYEALLQPVLGKVYPCTTEEIRVHTQKERRIIDVLEPVMNAHRLVVDPSVVEKDLKQVHKDPTYSLFHQMTRLTHERGALKHDDRLDALALGVAYWVEAMARDEQRAVKEWHDRQLDLELENFMDHVVGRKPNNLTWIG